ncbi:hypothetical protein D9M68_679610 [compost metagenome]
MEFAVALERQYFAVGEPAHRLDGAAHGVDVLALAHGSRDGGGLALDHAARADQLQRPPLGGRHRRAGAVRAVEHVHAGAGADLDPALDLQRDERFAHRGPAHAELLGQVALGGQARAHVELALGDQPPELVGNLAIEALGFDGLERHGSRAGGGRGGGSA